MYELSCCNEYGQIVIPENGEVLLRGINDAGHRDKLLMHFDTLEECQNFAKEWIKKFPHRACRVFDASEEVARYSYENLYGEQ